MPKGNSIASDVFGELLETGQQTVKAGAKTVADVAKQAVKTTLGGVKGDASGLDWLEKMAPQKQSAMPPVKSEKSRETEQKMQSDRLAKIDKQRSQRAYEEIQREIQMIRRQKQAEPPKTVTGATGYDPEQHQNPESFWDKIKKKKETMKNKLPWTSKQGMGSGEITRGVSG
jgi:hypothetical protein